MDLSPRWIELLELLNSKQIRFVVVGAYALAHHGWPRYTGHLDLYVSRDPHEARKLYEILAEFGAAIPDLTPTTFAEKGTMVTFGFEPHAVDILNRLSGVEWQEVYDNADKAMFGPIPVRYISIDDYKKNKLASGRPQDLFDVAKLTGQDPRS